MAWTGGEVTVAAAATRLSTALGLDNDTHVTEIRVATLAANPVYFGPSTLTATTNRRAVVAGANTSIPLYGPENYSSATLGDFYFIGTASDKLLVSINIK